MSEDFRVTSRSNSETRAVAKKLRAYFGVENDRRIDVIACAERKKIWTVNGERPLELTLCSDAELPDAHGITAEINGRITIRIRRSVRYGAYMGNGQDRNTFAHELGHAALGHAAYLRGMSLARGIQTASKPKWISHFESAEHQTKVFAPALLINDSVAETLSSAEDISAEFGISLTSAEIYFQQMTERRDRAASAERVRRIADEVRATLSPKKSLNLRFMEEPCPVCGQAKLIPMGVKSLCIECDNVSDRFQDGDAAI